MSIRCLIFPQYFVLLLADGLSEERILEIFKFFIKSFYQKDGKLWMIQDFMAVLAQEECRDLWLKYETRNLIEDLLQEIIMLKGMDRFYYVKRLK